MKEISFRKFLVVFYFPSDFIVVAENFEIFFLRSFSSKCFRNLLSEVHNNGKFEIFLGGVLKGGPFYRCVGLKIWVGPAKVPSIDMKAGKLLLVKCNHKLSN